MRIVYVSASTIPSRQANTVHVLNQIYGFIELGYKVDLFAKLNFRNEANIENYLKKSFGFDTKNISFNDFNINYKFGIEFFIALRFVFFLFKKSNNKKIIICRNLYAAYLAGIILRINLIYETHAPEKGIRKNIQFLLLKNKRIKSIVISKKLREKLNQYHNFNFKNIEIFPDAAKSGLEIFSEKKKKQILGELLEKKYFKFNFFCGYFGHLYPGRGIEVIYELSKRNRNFLFLVFGGTEEDIIISKKLYESSNLIFFGFLDHIDSLKILRCVDVLLMPYQRNVSIGIKGSNTADWMSPLKLFEYMSSGVPIISSDLPVLREILEDRRNALLVPPKNFDSWDKSLKIIRGNRKLASYISKNAFNEYMQYFNWKKRAENFIYLSKKI